jgi:hypothetical protein
MTIRIGSPSTPRGISLGSTVATTLKIAGIAAVAYGGACTLGIFAELANFKEVANSVCHLLEPAVNLTSSVYAGLARATLGEAVSQSPSVDMIVKVAASALMVVPGGAVLAGIGTKLARKVEVARDMLNHGNAPGNTHNAQPGSTGAIARLKDFKSALLSGAAPVAAAPVDVTDDQPRPQMG